MWIGLGFAIFITVNFTASFCKHNIKNTSVHLDTFPIVIIKALFSLKSMLKCKINQLLHCRGLEHQNWVNVILNVALTIWFTVTLLINSVMMGGERLFLFVFLCQRTPQEEGSPASG